MHPRVPVSENCIRMSTLIQNAALDIASINEDGIDRS